MRATCSAHLIFLNSFILIIYDEELKIIKPLTMKFSQTSCHFLHPRSKYSPQHPMQNTFCQCPHLLARRFFTSPPPLPKSESVGLYNLTFTFLDSRWEKILGGLPSTLVIIAMIPILIFTCVVLQPVNLCYCIFLIHD